MGSPGSAIEIHEIMKKLQVDTEDTQRNIYILSGVLGGVDLILIIAVIILIYAAQRVKTHLEDAIIERQVKEEIDAQKYAAYTGEEMHRRMLADTTPPAVPLSQRGGTKTAESEYAFNAPFVDDRILPQQNGGPTRNESSASRFNRY